jgi:hypothetical protein
MHLGARLSCIIILMYYFSQKSKEKIYAVSSDIFMVHTKFMTT